MITRRNILIGAAATVTNAAVPWVKAPGIVRADSLMAIRGTVMPIKRFYYGYVNRLQINQRYRSGELRGKSLLHVINEGVLRHIPPAYLAKGNYFSCSARAPFSHLIYPVPEPGGLGVHVTLDLAGQARFGPDVEWVDRIDYQVDPKRSERFYAAIRKYWPGLPDGALAPGYAGIRPKTAGPKEPAPDFEVQGPSVHGVPGLVHLFGIESPGLTASLSLAHTVLDTLGR